MFKDDSIDIKNNILDFIGNTDNDYFNDCDAVAKDWDRVITLETEILQNLCEILIPKEKKLKIVDVGCSDGYVINSLKGECVGVDCSRSRLTYLNDNVIKVRANVEHLPFQNEYFDVVICTDVFEHVENETELSYELYRILKPNGMLLFACPWEQDLSVYELEEFKKKYKLYKCRHIRSVDNKMIKKNFNNFKKINETMIISVRKFMEFTPYSIKFIQFLKE